MKCLVVDLGGSYMKYGIINENAEILEKGQVPSPVTGVQSFVDTICGVYEKYAGQVEGLAISMPGAVDSETGFTRTAGAFLDLYGQNVFDLLKEWIPVPVALENDGKCGALAEVWKGSLSDCQDGVVIIIGTGLAGGVIKNRRLHKGKDLTAGEFSCFMVKPGDYSMGNVICMPAAMMGLTMAVAAAKGIDMSTLETAAIMENAKEKSKGAGDSEVSGLAEGVDSVLSELEDAAAGKQERSETGEKAAAKAKTADSQTETDGAAADDTQAAHQVTVDGPQIFRWLEEGDPAVTAIYQNFIEHLAMMAYNTQVFYNPDKIVFGGGVSRQERLVPDIQAELDKIAESFKFLPVPPVKVGNCQFLSDANMVGAMYNYLIHFKPELAK